MFGYYPLQNTIYFLEVEVEVCKVKQEETLNTSIQNSDACNVKGHQSWNEKKIERERPAGKNFSLLIIHNYFQPDLDFSFTGERLSNFSLY